MKHRIFIATNGRGIARAEEGAHGKWSVDILLKSRDVRCLAAHPHNRNLIYAGMQGEGVLLSDDCGRTWQQAGLEGQVVKSLAVSPHHPNTLYAGTKPALMFASDDGGKTWRELEAFRRIPGRWYWLSPAEPPFQAYVQGIALSPADPQVILAGMEAGAVVRSQDGGQTWSGHLPGALRDCHSLSFHTNNGSWVYAGGGDGAALSRDGGRTWRRPREGLDRRYAWACTADPERPEVWYLSASPSFSWRYFAPQAHVDGHANAYIYRSVGGAPWQKLSGGLPQPLDYMAYALVTDPEMPGRIYAGLSNGDVWHSPDYGESWKLFPFNLGSIRRTMIMI